MIIVILHKINVTLLQYPCEYLLDGLKVVIFLADLKKNAEHFGEDYLHTCFFYQTVSANAAMNTRYLSLAVFEFSGTE